MGMYEALRAADVIGPVESKIENAGYVLCADSKIRGSGHWRFGLGGPWINSKICMRRNCRKWYHIYYDLYGIIPRGCFHCWKIVILPKTLKELFALYELQDTLVKESDDALPCKCGIERREYRVHAGPYAGIFYCPLEGGLEEAREWHAKIERRIHKAMGVQHNVILKRACTEYEEQYGPSNLWKYPEAQDAYEDLLDATWVVSMQPPPDPASLRVVVTERWIEYAVRFKDPTAKDYYKDLGSFGFGGTVTYHKNKLEPDFMPKLAPIVKEEVEGGETPKIQRLPSD